MFFSPAIFLQFWNCFHGAEIKCCSVKTNLLHFHAFCHGYFRVLMLKHEYKTNGDPSRCPACPVSNPTMPKILLNSSFWDFSILPDSLAFILVISRCQRLYYSKIYRSIVFSTISAFRNYSYPLTYSTFCCVKA